MLAVSSANDYISSLKLRIGSQFCRSWIVPFNYSVELFGNVVKLFVTILLKIFVIFF